MAELITLVANVSLSLSFIVALLFGMAQVRAAARDRRERLTLEALRTFQTREFAELIVFVTRYEVPPNLNEVRALPEKDQVPFIQFAQEMESLGLLVAERYINIDLVDKTLGSLVTTTWEKYKPLVEHTRVNQPDPFLCEYFQWLAERLDERLQGRPRTPFHETRRPAPRKNDRPVASQPAEAQPEEAAPSA